MRKKPKSYAKPEMSYLARFMGALYPDQKRLNEIQAVYDNLTLLGQLLGAGTDITSMRQNFQELASVLLDQLAREHYKKATLSLSSCARVAIDILIRNLYERTADIGFLATDNEICAYAEAVAADPAVRGDAARLSSLSTRFAEYVAKYSVYHNIILLSPEGEVLAQLDRNNPATHSADNLVQEALTTSAGFVEVFRPTDLLPDEAGPLIYAYRVMSEDGSHPVGVLCLCFRFEDECQRIFEGLVSQDDWTIVTLLDANGRIIASSDAYQFPLGAKLDAIPDNECRIMRFDGREYLATTRLAHPYQGYTGSGWMGHVMAPLNHAFEMAEAQELEGVRQDYLAGVLDVATLFGQTLRDIPVKATRIQQELNRAVWNGNIWLARENNAQNSAFAKVLLREIGSTGVRTRNVFSESTDNLYKTVVSSVLFDCGTQAALAIDIMDRNLYERANDCRWWALTRAFREELAHIDPEDRVAQQRLTAILRRVNDLYTVYSNLILFDTAGRIVAVSNPAYADTVGRPIIEPWMRSTLSLKNGQSYCVSEFAPTSLYAGEPTFIYSAAVRDIASDEPVGGIAIVFDATSQFKAMLSDALPRQEDGAIINDAFAVFAEADGKIIAGTHAELPPGGKINVSKAFFSIERGESTADIIDFNGRYYSVGSCKSAGYREYKSESDAYQKEVVALVFTPLSATLAEEGAAARRIRNDDAYFVRQAHNADTRDIASFYIGRNWYGLHPGFVLAAVDADRLTHMPGSAPWIAGCLMFEEQAISVVDISSILAQNENAPSERRRDAPNHKKQILVLKSAERNMKFGLLIDNLGQIAEIETERIEAVPGMMADDKSIIDSLVKPRQEDKERRILVVLSTEKILQRFSLN